MATELKHVGTSVYEVEATLGKEKWNECGEKAFDKLANKVSIKGFRKGKAPKSLLKDKINPNDLFNEQINLALNELYRSILEEHHLRPFTQPQVDVTKVDDSGLSAKFTITVFPEVKLGNYKGIEIELEKVSVSKAEVDAEIKKLLSDNAELVLKEAPAEMGDTVIFDFKGYINGKEFEGGSANNYELVLGSNQFIPGFEEQLVGATSESKVDVNVTFPEQYVKDLAGKDAKFVCMVHEIKAKHESELNDEFAQSLGYANVSTVEELKTYVKTNLTNKKNTDATNKHFQDVVNTIVEGSEIEISDAVLESESKRYKEDLTNRIAQNGITLDQYKEITGLTDEALNEQFKAQALADLRQELTFDKIAEVENLRITQRDLDQYFSDSAARYGMKVEEVRKYFTDETQHRALVSNLYHSKIFNFIRANNPVPTAKVEEKPVVEEASKAKKTSTGTKKTTTAKKAVKAEASKEKKEPAKKTTAKKTTTAKKVTTKKETKAE